jgi:hypothetical protein
MSLPPFSRRAFLAGAGALTLVACSGGGHSASSSSSSGEPDLVLGTLFAQDALVPGSPQRMPVALFDKDGVVLDKPPPTLAFTVVGPDEQPVSEPITVTSHGAGLPRPYYPLIFTPPMPGVYTISAQPNGTLVNAHVQIPATSDVPRPGQAMVPVDTPTTADPHGELVCTRQPPCPLHDVTLREALAGGTPVAFIIATPKYCQTAICGPVLDVLLSAKDQFPTVKMVHAEVYPSDAAAQPATQETTEAVKAYNLSYEPVLFLAKPDGTIAQRIDTIFDEVEVRQALTQLTS